MPTSFGLVSVVLLLFLIALTSAYIPDFISGPFAHGGQFYATVKPKKEAGILLSCGEDLTITVSDWDWESCLLSQFSFKDPMRTDFARPYCIARFCGVY
ncbi:hypothetical protein FO519_006653 [Halicephalobus sp. NKZ332]|nr:hypothetical protein FO519_006653 [Halicephalobus sp. NKZ332]